MKKFVTLATIVTVFFTSCKKEVTVEEEIPTVSTDTLARKVQFSLNVFDVSYENISNKKTGASYLD